MSQYGYVGQFSTEKLPCDCPPTRYVQKVGVRQVERLTPKHRRNITHRYRCECGAIAEEEPR